MCFMHYFVWVFIDVCSISAFCVVLDFAEIRHTHAGGGGAKYNNTNDKLYRSPGQSAVYALKSI
jgi:hypothetical protein